MSKAIEIYQSIDELPVFNWFKIHEKNDLAYLLVKKHKITGKMNEQLEEAWGNIYTEYLDTFGINNSFRQILLLKKEIACYELEMFIKGDKSIITFIKIAKWQLKKLLNEKPSSTIDEFKVQIERYMGFRLNTKEVTVKEYYTYINALIKQPKKLKHEQSN